MSTELGGDLRFPRARRVAGSVWVRLFVTLALLGIVASRIDWAIVGQRLGHGHPVDFAIAVLLVLCSLVVGAYRWRGLLAAAGVNLSPSQLARAYAVSTFSGTFLPTTVGGDVTRTLLVVRRGPLLLKVVVSVVVDRAGGLLGLIGIAWLALALRPSSVPKHAGSFLVWATAAVGFCCLAVIGCALRSPRRVARILPERLVRPAGQAVSVLRDYARNPRLVVLVIGSSLVFQALVALQLVFLGRAINVHLPFATAAVALALVTIVTLIPVSIGGFGVREGTYVILLGGASIGATDATLISVLSVATLFLVSLPGALLLARGGIAPALRDAAP
jgi:uncharacterized protein (TIRG00374 family)